MKTFLLALLMIKKRFSGLLLIFAEMIISIICLLTFGSEIDHMLKSREVAYSITGEDRYVFSVYRGYRELDGFDFERIIPKEYSGHIEVGSSAEMRIYTPQESVRALVYSDMILRELHLIDMFDCGDDEAIPALAFGKVYEAGSEIVTSDGQRIRIAAKLDGVRFLPFYSGMSSANVLSLDKYVKEVTGSGIILQQRNDGITGNLRRSDTIVIKMQGLDERSKTDLLQLLGGYGQVVSVDVMKDNYVRDKKIDLTNNILMFAVFTTMVTVGIIGTNNMWAEKNKRLYSVMYITGMTRKKSILLEVIISAFVFLLTYLIIILFYDNLTAAFIRYDTGENKVLYLAVIMIYLMIVYFASSIGNIRAAADHDLIDLYKRNCYDD